VLEHSDALEPGTPEHSDVLEQLGRCLDDFAQDMQRFERTVDALRPQLQDLRDELDVKLDLKAMSDRQRELRKRGTGDAGPRDAAARLRAAALAGELGEAAARFAEQYTPLAGKLGLSLPGQLRLTTSSHPGQGLCRLEYIAVHGGHGWWLGLGPAAKAEVAVRPGGSQGPILNALRTDLGLHIAEGQHQTRVGNAVLFGSWDQPSFTLNEDGTISPSREPSLVLGFAACPYHCRWWKRMVVFVERGSRDKLVFDELLRGRAVAEAGPGPTGADEESLQNRLHMMCLKLSTLQQAVPGTSGAFIEGNIKAESDDRVHERWSQAHAVLPEYRGALEMICLRREWMTDTILLRHLREASRLFPEDLELIRLGGDDAFNQILLACIQKAYGLRSEAEARAKRDLMAGGSTIHGQVGGVYKNLEGWKKPFFVHGLKVMLDLEQDAAAITAKLAEVCDRALHCPHVQVKSFGLILSHAYRLAFGSGTGQPGEASEGDAAHAFGGALIRFYECFEDFLDDHKENAFNAVFQEPGRFYLTHFQSQGHLKDNVDTHANNWYLSMLNSTLNIHVPILPTYWDDYPLPLSDHWHALSDEVWKHFKDPAHFGNHWQGIPGLKRMRKDSYIRRKIQDGTFPSGNSDIRPAKHFANQAVNPKASPALRKSVAVYLEKFAYFFSREFFIKKAFETLNSECKPEHVGFRKALEVLFATYRQEQGVAEETYIEHLYADDMYIEFRLAECERLFVWLGVLKPTAACQLPPARTAAERL
jgi:hypothetical protein